MDRRSLLKFGGMASIGFALEGCATKTSGAKPQTQPKQARRVLPAVNASWDRIIRTTIGLRPHRPSGFVLRAEKLDNKTLIHNFGHGGSGMSLSWGTASMATDIALEQAERKAAVLGSGVVGLTSARELQRHGFDVTIYAATVPPDTTSKCRWRVGRRHRDWSTPSCARRRGTSNAATPRASRIVGCSS